MSSPPNNIITPTPFQARVLAVPEDHFGYVQTKVGSLSLRQT